MSDIVERLRASYDPAKGGAKLGAEIYRQAADEIERLRAVLRPLLEHYLNCYDGLEDRLAKDARVALEGE